MSVNIYDNVKDSLAGHDKPKKAIKHITTRKAGKGYIHEHHHTRPDEHPMEEHISSNQDEMVKHMMDNMVEDSGASDAAAPQGNASPQAANEQQSEMVGA